MLYQKLDKSFNFEMKLVHTIRRSEVDVAGSLSLFFFEEKWQVGWFRMHAVTAGRKEERKEKASVTFRAVRYGAHVDSGTVAAAGWCARAYLPMHGDVPHCRLCPAVGP